MKFLAIFAFIAVAGMASAAPTYDLQGDLHEFVELIPIDEIRAIAKRYVETDAEFQEVVRYLQGEEWAKLVATVRDNPTWIEFKNYMNKAGIDIEGIIQFIHDLIAGVEVPRRGASPLSVRDFVDEVKAIIPTDELLNLFSEKLANSPDFQEFYAKVSSDESRALVEQIRAIEEVKRIAQRLRDMGLDIDKVLEFIYGILGWN